MSHARTRLSPARPVAPRAAPAQSADAITLVAFACVLVAVPLVTCNAVRISENMTFGDPLLAFGGVLLAFAWLLRGHAAGIVPSGFVLGAILLLIAGLLAIVGSDSTESLVPTLRLVVTFAAMPLIVLFAANSAGRVNLLVDAWLAAVAVNSLVGASDLLGVTSIGVRFSDIDFVGLTNRAQGLTLHPNHLGLVAAMGVPVAVARLATGGARGAIALMVVPILIGGVFVSGSRGASIAVAGGVVLVFVLGAGRVRSRTGMMLAAAVALAVGVLAFAPIDTERLSQVTIERLAGGGGAADSDAARRQAYGDAVADIAGNPLVGQGFALVRTAHNIYLQLLQAGGVIALAGFLAFAFAMLSVARRVARPAPGVPVWLTALAAGCGASLGVWLLYGLVGNAIYDRYLYIPVGLVLAIAFVHRNLAAAGATEPPLPQAREPAPASRGWAAPALPRARGLAGR